MRVTAAVITVALCVFSAAQMRDANAVMSAAKVVPVSQRGDATGDEQSKKNQHSFPILQGHGDGDFETPPVQLRRIRRQHRQLQKTESLISWLFESARDYWNFKHESKRDKQESEEKEENNSRKDKKD